MVRRLLKLSLNKILELGIGSRLYPTQEHNNGTRSITMQCTNNMMQDMSWDGSHVVRNEEALEPNGEYDGNGFILGNQASHWIEGKISVEIDIRII